MTKNEKMAATTSVLDGRRKRAHLLLHDISRKRHVLILGKEYAKEYVHTSTFNFDFISLIHDLEAFYADGTIPADENILPKLPPDYRKEKYVFPETLDEAIVLNYMDIFLKFPAEHRCCVHYGECDSHYNDRCKDCCACIFPPE